MGNSDIRDFAQIENINVSEIAGEKVAVDASNWLYKYMTTTARFTNTEAYTNDDGVKLTNLIGVPRGVRKYFKRNIQPVFVFDGKPHTLKSEEIKRRKDKKSSANSKMDEAKNSVEKSKYESRSQQLSNDVISTTKKLLDLLDIPYTTAPQAAESQAAYMNRNSDQIQSVISDDYDTLVFGSNRTIRKFTTSSKSVELIDFDKTLKNLDISHKQLVLSTILCGTDYNDGVSGVGPKTALKIVRKKPTIKKIREETGEDIKRAEDILDLYMNPSVTDEWPEPKVSNPDIENTIDYLYDQGIDISEVEKAIQDIDDSSSQTGLKNF